MWVYFESARSRRKMLFGTTRACAGEFMSSVHQIRNLLSVRLSISLALQSVTVIIPVPHTIASCVYILRVRKTDRAQPQGQILEFLGHASLTKGVECTHR